MNFTWWYYELIWSFSNTRDPVTSQRIRDKYNPWQIHDDASRIEKNTQRLKSKIRIRGG